MFTAQTFFASLVFLSVFVVGGVLLVSSKVFRFLAYVLLGFVPSGLLNLRGGFLFPFEGFFTLYFFIFLFFSI